MRIGTLAELENRPAAIRRDPAQVTVRIDDHRMPDGFEKREVGVAVGIRRAIR
jgi:hypothetical protein